MGRRTWPLQVDVARGGGRAADACPGTTGNRERAAAARTGTNLISRLASSRCAGGVHVGDPTRGRWWQCSRRPGSPTVVSGVTRRTSSPKAQPPSRRSGAGCHWRLWRLAARTGMAVAPLPFARTSSGWVGTSTNSPKSKTARRRPCASQLAAARACLRSPGRVPHGPGCWCVRTSYPYVYMQATAVAQCRSRRTVATQRPLCHLRNARAGWFASWVDGQPHCSALTHARYVVPSAGCVRAAALPCSERCLRVSKQPKQ